ncbi:indole-3-glycerol phosphate synthase TrpC [Methanobrevibacter sp. DSM 116169]|uniref:indole-3-glycerol phosphate synthase TrpC n=1 Tax=Methanobrevibacter sp. DSM 116169 TaxID=3242727 RepID=UPI0038FCA550
MLNKIVEKTIQRLKENKKKKSLDDLKKEINLSNSLNSFPFKDNLENKEFSIIAEIKKASPSKGIISEDFDYISIAKEYEIAKVDAISILTEPYFFKGENLILTEISNQTNIPLLRKDFIIDEYMIYESKIIGADAILLIVAILDENQLKNYIKLANSLGLSTLVETHSKNEIEIALKAGADIIGVNNRDLKTFKVDLNTSIDLRKYIPEDIIFISESGIKNKEDIAILKNNNINGVLIGETLMKSNNKVQLIKEFKND